jgi:hypothetical protein
MFNQKRSFLKGCVNNFINIILQETGLFRNGVKMTTPKALLNDLIDVLFEYSCLKVPPQIAEFIPPTTI